MFKINILVAYKIYVGGCHRQISKLKKYLSPTTYLINDLYNICFPKRAQHSSKI